MTERELHVDTAILCQRVDKAGPHVALKAAAFNSKPEPCSGCGDPVWVAPSSITMRERELAAGHTVALVCNQCLARTYRKHPEVMQNRHIGKNPLSELTEEEQVVADDLRAFMAALDPDQLADFLENH